MTIKKIMYIAVVQLLTITLAACNSGGGSDLPPLANLQVGNVSGYVFDAVVDNADVTIYEFNGGRKGAMLGQGTTNAIGYFSIDFQTADTMLLIESINGSYVEEASGVTVNPGANQVLTTLLDFAAGSSVIVSVTPYTHLSSGLALYNYNNGATLSVAISEANTTINNLIGVNIVTETPLDITNGVNTSPSLNNGLLYGFYSAGISQWSLDASRLHGVSDNEAPYNSISFAQMMYRDILNDGMLNGVAFDRSGVPENLNVGTIIVDANTYRHGIAKGIMDITNSVRNVSNVTREDLLVLVNQFNNNSDPMFAGTAIVALDEGRSSVMLTDAALNGAWRNGTTPIDFIVSDIVGVPGNGVEILVSGMSDGMATRLIDWSYGLDTTTYTTLNTQYQVTIRVTNYLNTVTDFNFQLGIDNIAPVACWQSFVGSGAYTVWSGIWQDTGSGVSSVIRNNQQATLTSGTPAGDVVSGTWTGLTTLNGSEAFVSYPTSKT